MKKQWQIPQLVIFCRGRAEEAVLHSCKTHGDGGPCGSVDRCRGGSVRVKNTAPDTPFCAGSCNQWSGT